jgi:hypothetical protein
LDKNNILQKSAKNCLKENEIIKLNFICKNKEINTNKITVEICYYIKDKKFENSYEIIPYEFPKGEELSKLIIYDNILKNPIKNTENLNNALKYQILYENTSLYANLELSDKIQEQLRLKLIGNKEGNIIKIFKPKKEGKKKEMRKEIREEEEEDIGFGDIFDGRRGVLENNSEGIEDKKIEKNEIKPDLKNTDYVMEIINTQDFIEGFWEENEKTKCIKEKYNKAFDLLKNKNINDNTSITILLIYFINKEHPELLDELLMIIKKAKEFIKKSTNISYEDIIKEININ